MPIIDEDGRPRSVRTAEEESEILHRDIERLPLDEQVAVMEAVENIGATATKGWKKAVEAEYARKPVDVRTFLTDHYYLGHIGAALWPRLVEDMVDLFEGDYHEGVLSGSLGWGKSFFATTAMAYVLYQMSCLRDPQSAYGIARGSAIYVAMLSTTEKVARRVAIQELLGKIEHSPYFREHFPHNAAPSNLEIRFPNQVWVVAGSTGSSAIIGLNAYAGFIDESSFMGEAQEMDRQGRVIAVDLGEQIHKSIIRRMKSRFQRVGRLPGVLITASSKERPNAFIEKRIREAREQEDPTFFVREYATWHVKPSDHFSEDTFTVVAGSERVASKILGKAGEVNQDELDRYKDMGLQVVEVPIDYLDDFQRDIDGSLRDIAGVATDAVSNFMARTEKIFEASEDAPIVNPVGWEGDDDDGVEEWVTNQPLNIRWSAIAQSYDRRLPGGYTEQAWRPLRHPSAPRYVHIDSSLSGDSTGIVIAHVARWKEVVRRDPWGEEYAELAPVIEVDLILRITAAPGDEIMLADVRSIVYQFQAHGFNVSYASMDQYQCLARGTPVHTGRGIIPIEDVGVGDEVQSRSGVRKVKNTFWFGHRDTLRLTTQDGDVLEGTDGHRVEVQVGWTGLVENEWGKTKDPVWEWRRLDEIRAGDVVRGWGKPTDLDPPDVELLGEKTEFGWRDGGGRRSAIDEWVPPDRMTPQLAEWLGLVWGDGQVQGDGVRLTVTADESEDAAQVFLSLFGVDPTFRDTGNGMGTLSVSSRWLVRWMDHNGLTKPLIPQAVMRSSREVRSAFLRGLFSADGNVGRIDGKVSLSTKHKGLADQVRLILRVDFGIESYLSFIERGHPGDYVPDGVQYVVGLRGPRQRFFDRIGFSYRRKQEELERHLLVRGRRKFTRVVDIHRSKADVFDLEIDGDPSYVANGIVSHNSADSLQQFRKHGIEAELVSVDRTTDAYDTLKDAIYEGRVTLYEHRWLQCELKNVQRIPSGRSGRVKIDHAKKMTGPDGTQVPGSKDVSDALAGVAYGLTQRMPGRPVPPMLGPTNADQGEKADHSWVSGGKVMIQSEGGTKGGGQGNVPTEKGPGTKGPMPFIKG